MEIKQAIEAKKKMEVRIEAAIVEFREMTGLNVMDVSIRRIDASSISGEKVILVDVTTIVNLP